MVKQQEMTFQRRMAMLWWKLSMERLSWITKVRILVTQTRNWNEQNHNLLCLSPPNADKNAVGKSDSAAVDRASKKFHLNAEATSADPEVEQLTKLPETVTQLTSKDGVKVYLVGTAHFSQESQEDVAKVKRMSYQPIHYRDH